jgi:hypothetical protein
VSKIVGVVQVHRLVSDLHAGHDFAIPGASSDLYSWHCGVISALTFGVQG